MGGHVGRVANAGGGRVAVHPFAAVTLREIVHVSNGGEQVRVRFTNEFGLDGLTISDAHVALSAGGRRSRMGRITPDVWRREQRADSAGAAMYSDPVALAVAPLSDVAVSFYLPSQVMRAETYHALRTRITSSRTAIVTGRRR